MVLRGVFTYNSSIDNNNNRPHGGTMRVIIKNTKNTKNTKNNEHKTDNNKATPSTLWLERVYSEDSRFVSSKVYSP